MEDSSITPMHDNTIEEIWQDEENRKLLDKVLSSPETSGKARFLACEVFFHKDIFFLQRHKPEWVAGIYAEALKKNYPGFANSWGLLYEDGEGSCWCCISNNWKKCNPCSVKTS